MHVLESRALDAHGHAVEPRTLQLHVDTEDARCRRSTAELGKLAEVRLQTHHDLTVGEGREVDQVSDVNRRSPGLSCHEDGELHEELRALGPVRDGDSRSIVSGARMGVAARTVRMPGFVVRVHAVPATDGAHQQGQHEDQDGASHGVTSIPMARSRSISARLAS